MRRDRTLARIPVPTTLVRGREDRILPLARARSASARFGRPLHVVDDAGHPCFLDRPDAVLQALRDALPGSGR